MNNIASVFSQPGHKALIPYVTVGYPSIEATLKIVPILARSGCDMVELGIPFSDPLADGTTIQKASFGALSNGVTPSLCFEVAKQLSQEVDIPLLFMTYLNPVYHYGFEAFCTACNDAGVSGLIIPDLPPDECLELEAAAGKQELDIIYFLTPTSTENRIRLVSEKARGFIYLVSITGVTGVRDSLPRGLNTFVGRVKRITSQPLCIGFGISTPGQAKKIASVADGVIIGSRIIQLMEAEGNFESVQDFIGEVRGAIDKLDETDDSQM